MSFLSSSLEELENDFIPIIENLVEPYIFSLTIKPYLRYINNDTMNRLYYALKKSDRDDYIIESYWLLYECRNNERVYMFVKKIIDNFK